MANIRRNLAVQITAGGTNPLKMRIQQSVLKLLTTGSIALIGQGGVTPYAFSMVSGALPTVATVTASITTNVMTVTAVANGTLAVGQVIAGAGITYGTKIASLGTGTGGTGTYNLTSTPNVASETITASPALSAAGVATFATGTLPSVVGSFSFVAQVQDSTSPTPQVYVAAFTVAVAHVLSGANVAPSTAEIGQTYSYQYTINGATGAVTWAVTSGSAPAGLSLSSAGLLSGTPTGPAAATSYFTVTATDAGTGDVLSIVCAQVVVAKLSLGNFWVASGAFIAPLKALHADAIINGKVIAAGGFSTGGPNIGISDCEIYDPVTGIWSAAGSLNTARFEMSACTVSGKVLVAGGETTATTTTTASEVYSPSTNTWSNTVGAMATARARYGDLILLGTGKVLAVAGMTGSLGTGVTTSCELYDPVAGTWSATGAITTGRMLHTVTLLNSGNVLLAGGLSGTNTALQACMTYNGTTWAATTNSLTTGRYWHTATKLNDGRVIVAGGTDNTSIFSSCEIYTPATNSWTAGPSMNSGHSNHKAVLLSDGRVLVVGGTCEIFDPILNTWTVVTNTNYTHSNQSALLLSDNSVLYTGSPLVGTSTTPSVSERYYPSLLSDRIYTVGTAVADSLVVALNGTGAAPYTFTYTNWSAGAAPVGLTFNPNGTITGTPQASIVESVTVTITDRLSVSVSQTMGVSVKKSFLAAQQNGVGTGTQGWSNINVIGGGATAVSDDNTLTITILPGANYPGSPASNSTTTVLATFPLWEYSNDTNFAQIQFGKSRAASNSAAPVATNSGDILGRIDFQGVNTSPAVVDAAYIQVVQDGAGGASFIPTRIELYTGTNAAAAALAATFDRNKTLIVVGGVNCSGAIGVSVGNDTIFHDAAQGLSVVPIGGTIADFTAWNSLGVAVFYVIAGTNNTQTIGTHNANNIVGTVSVSTAAYKYATGSGGTVTQLTSKATGVTLNKVNGQITMINAALAAATSVSFTLTNSTITATSTVIVNIGSAATANSYSVTVDAVAAGSCRIQIRNVSAGSLSEALVLNFAVLNSVNA